MENSKDIVYLNGKDVTSRIREKDVAKIVSFVSSIKEVRFKLNEIFKKCAKSKNVIMEGRDIGTYVFPNAEVKIYLDATPEERAKRRYKQNQILGIDMPYEEILENIKIRDKNDMEKEIGALKKAEDAIYIDSTNMTIEEVVNTPCGSYSLFKTTPFKAGKDKSWLGSSSDPPSKTEQSASPPQTISMTAFRTMTGVITAITGCPEADSINSHLTDCPFTFTDSIFSRRAFTCKVIANGVVKCCSIL